MQAPALTEAFGAALNVVAVRKRSEAIGAARSGQFPRRLFAKDKKLRFRPGQLYIDQSAATSSMWSMTPRLARSAKTCAAASEAVSLLRPTMSSGSSGGS
jgi:hypothetical protein